MASREVRLTAELIVSQLRKQAHDEAHQRIKKATRSS